MIAIYTKSNCDKCEEIKRRLNEKGVDFREEKTSEPEIMQGLISKLKNAGLKNPMLPVLEFDDGSFVSNDMGLYKELRHREIL